MKRMKIVTAVIIYLFLIAIGNWAGGTGIKDEWDSLMKWAYKRK